MFGIIRFVFSVIWFAIGLAMAGTLVEATSFMGKQAAISSVHGISYSWWNRQLVGNAQGHQAQALRPQHNKKR